MAARPLRFASLAFVLLATATAAVQIRNVEWGQSEEKVFVYFPRTSKCDASSFEVLVDRLALDCDGALPAAGRLSVALHSDVQPAQSKCAPASRGAVECALRKEHAHHWERLTALEQEPALPRLRVNYGAWYEAPELIEDWASPRDGIDLAAKGVHVLGDGVTAGDFDAVVSKAAAAGAPVVSLVHWAWCDQNTQPCAKTDVQEFADAAGADNAAGAAFFSVDGMSVAGREVARRLGATCAAACRAQVLADGVSFAASVAGVARRSERWRSPLVPATARSRRAEVQGDAAFVVMGAGAPDGSVAHGVLKRASTLLNDEGVGGQPPSPGKDVRFFREEGADGKAAEATVFDAAGRELGTVTIPQDAGDEKANGATLASSVAALLQPPVITDEAETGVALAAAEKAGKPVVYFWTAEKASDESVSAPDGWDADEDGEWEAPLARVRDTPALLERELAPATEVARERKGAVTFISPGSTWGMADFGLDEKGVRPAAGILAHGAGGTKTRHALHDAGSAEQLRKALDALAAGTLEASYKSSDGATEFEDGQVQTLTGKTHTAAAAAGPADVLVLFYSSYGTEGPEHTAAAEAARVLASSGLRVAKLDTAKNAYDTRVFGGMEEYDDKPYFFFKTTTRKKALRFKGQAPTVAALIKWMREKSRRLRGKKTWARAKANLKALRAEKKAAAAAEEEEKKALAARIAKAEKVDLTPDKDGGVVLQQYAAGSGEVPRAGATVKAHYVGTLESDGTEFDSSRGRGEPFSFELGRGGVIKCWDLAFAAMTVGSKAVITCASKYAYGDAGSPPKIPGGATLKFDVELVSFTGGSKDEL